MNILNYSKIRTNGGYAAIAVTMIITVVVGLIVLGFALSSRQEEQRSLNNQLSTEAYYADESAVNDAYSIITNDYVNHQPIVPQTQHCNQANSGYPAGTYSSASSLSGSNNNVQYTCLLVNPLPPTLEYSPIDTGHGQVVPIFPVDNSGNAITSLSSLNITWQAENVPAGANFASCPSSGSFYAQTTYSPNWPSSCAAPVLQVDIAPTSGWNDAAQLIQLTKTIFLEPVGSGGVASIASWNNGQVVGVQCSSPPVSSEYDCNINIGNLPVSPGCSSSTCNPAIPGGSYYLHIIPIYDNANMSISAPGVAGFNNAQALIDVTANASGELKRVQERISINPVGSDNEPTNGLQSTQSICKNFTVRPGIANPSTSCPN